MTSQTYASKPYPAPSVADLERWFNEDVAEFQASHPNAVAVRFDQIDEWPWQSQTDANANSSADSAADSSVVSPPTPDRPDEEHRVVSVTTPARMIEEIYIPTAHALALAEYNVLTKTINYANRVLARKSADKKQRGDEYYVPLESKFDLPGRGAILLPSEAAPYGTQAQLVEEIKRFVHRYADLPEFWEDLIAHYVLMSWVYDRFSALPYLRFLGEPGTGKTRALEVAGALSYKGITLNGASSISPLFRLIDQWHGTLIIDEADYKSSNAEDDIVKILTGGYTRGKPVWRSDGKNFDSRPFDVYGPKILSTRGRYGDYALETRCLTYETVEKPLRADVPLQLPSEFHEEAQLLRNKLLQWRFDNFHRIKLDDAKLRQVDARLGQIGSSLYAVATDERFRTDLVKYFSRQGKREKSQRPQAMVLEAIRRLLGAESDVLETAAKKKGNRLTVKAVAEAANRVGEDWGQGEESMSAKAAGALIRSLGFEPKPRNGVYQFGVDRKKLAELIVRHGLER